VPIAEDNMPWLNDLADNLNAALAAAAASADPVSGPDVFFVDPQPYFSGHNLCTSSSGINTPILVATPGEDAMFMINDLGLLVNGTYASQESVHPNDCGTQLYADALEDALALHP